MENQERFTEVFDKAFYEKALQHALNKVNLGLDVFISQYPHVSENNVYKPQVNGLWTSSFYPGMAYLAYDITGDSKYLKHGEAYLDSFEERLAARRHINHDLGFLFTLSSVASHKLTGNQRAFDLAVKASDMLIERYSEKGKYIQAWGEMGAKYPDVKIIIDTMLNLPLLYWTGDERKREIAYQHAKTSAKYLIRDDFSSYHTYLMNPDTGEAVCGKTHQGYEDESTWARGQGWSVYGFILSYGYTRDEEFLQVARKTAEYFIKNLPEDFVPYWDFHFHDEQPDIRDTSAGAIFVCGLLELMKYVPKEEADFYRRVVHTVMKSLHDKYSTKDIPKSNGLLKEGMYHRNNGANECTSWGDYFYFEALVRILKDWEIYW